VKHILTDDEHMLGESVKTHLDKHTIKLVNLKEIHKGIFIEEFLG